MEVREKWERFFSPLWNLGRSGKGSSVHCGSSREVVKVLQSTVELREKWERFFSPLWSLGRSGKGSSVHCGV